MDDPVQRADRTGAHRSLHDLGRLLLAEHTPESVLQRVVVLAQQAMPGEADVSITVVRDEGPTTAAATGPAAARIDEVQYDRKHGPCLETALSGQVTEIADARAEERWPECVPALVACGVLSALCAPVPAPHLNAGLNVYARAADAFTDDDRAVLSDLTAYAGAALTNMDALQDARELAANLQKAMESRAVIEQAKGILVERYKLTPEQAFRLLAGASMRVNRKVRDLAEELVLTGELPGAPPEHRPPPEGGG